MQFTDWKTNMVKITIIDAKTGEVVERQMNESELANYENNINNFIAEQAEQKKAAEELRTAKISAYQKLGLTEAEIEALLPKPIEPILLEEQSL
jgi:hypothetical protein